MHPINRQLLILFIAFCMFMLLLYLFTSDGLYRPDLVKVVKNRTHKPTIILFWTTIMNERPNMTGICPASTPPCVFTSDRSNFMDASALVFHVSEFRDLSHTRLKLAFPQQKYVFFSLEAPPSLEVAGFGRWWKDEIKFHWIASYERNAHIRITYGNVTELSKLDGNYKPLGTSSKASILASKRIRGAAWFVSNCSPQERLKVAKAIQRNNFRVDIGGRCSPNQKLKCNIDADCERLIGHYYFYLAFENANCLDYATEKIFNRLYANTPVVPIVMKRSVYENVLPAEAFIAIDDFPSVKKLVEHLNFLMDNPDEYVKLFEWRSKWARTGFWRPDDYLFGFCWLCEKVHREQNNIAEWIPDTQKWFETNSKCTPAVPESWYN